MCGYSVLLCLGVEAGARRGGKSKRGFHGKASGMVNLAAFLLV